MAMVDVGPAAYRRIYSPSRLAWSEGRRPLGAALNLSDELQMHHKHRPSIIIIIIIINWIVPSVIIAG